MCIWVLWIDPDKNRSIPHRSICRVNVFLQIVILCAFASLHLTIIGQNHHCFWNVCLTLCSHRCSLSGKDLNRQWIQPSRSLFPTVYHTKALMAWLQARNKSPFVCPLTTTLMQLFHDFSTYKKVLVNLDLFYLVIHVLYVGRDLYNTCTHCELLLCEKTCVLPFVCLGVLRLPWSLTTQEYFYVWLQGCQELKSTWGISISSATDKLMYGISDLWSTSTCNYIAQNDILIHDWREFAFNLGSRSIFSHTHTHTEHCFLLHCRNCRPFSMRLLLSSAWPIATMWWKRARNRQLGWRCGENLPWQEAIPWKAHIVAPTKAHTRLAVVTDMQKSRLPNWVADSALLFSFFRSLYLVWVAVHTHYILSFLNHRASRLRRNIWKKWANTFVLGCWGWQRTRQCFLKEVQRRVQVHKRNPGRSHGRKPWTIINPSLMPKRKRKVI